MSSSAVRKARIGEVPQAEGFGKKQRCSFANLQKIRFAADGRTPSARRLATSPVTTDVATQGKTLQRFDKAISNKFDCSSLGFRYL